jgi:2-polyprenyl-6-methoxyphenol hydroxylase-like FAD-dependent oxidoreductase
MHPESSRFDVVVVGARAAGAATAMLLARSGRRVLVVDRSRYGADTLSTHALMRGGVLQLHRWGLLDRIVDVGTPAIRTTAFRYADDEIVVTIKPAHGVDALYAPRRTVLDSVLVDAAIEAGAEVRYGVTVTGVHRDDRGRVRGIEARDESGWPVTVDADLVVGADGLRSTVAREVGAPVEHFGSGAAALVYGYWSDLDADGYEWIFRPEACAGLIPTNGGQTCIFVASTPARIGRGGRPVFDEVLEQASPDTASRVRAATAPAGVRTFAGHPGYLRRSWGPGWALVGDAGYWKDPLSAHGLTDALRDAELLVRAVVSSDVGDQPGNAALAAYQSARDRVSLPLFTTINTIAAMRWSEAEIKSLLLQLNSTMADEIDAIAALDAVAVP